MRRPIKERAIIPHPSSALLQGRVVPIMMTSMKHRQLTALLVLGLGLVPCCGQSDRPPLVICCAGDSLMRPMPHYFRQLLPSLSPNFVIEEWAQGGLGSATYQSFYNQHAERWRRVAPDFILLQIGTNDAAPLAEGRSSPDDFQANLTAIIREFQSYRNPAGKAALVLVATVPLFSDDPVHAGKNQMVKDIINPAIRRAAESAGALLADNFSVLNGKPELYDPDGVHPNVQGEEALAKNWVKAMKAFLEKKG